MDIGTTITLLDTSVVERLRLSQRGAKHLMSGTSGLRPPSVGQFPAEIRLYDLACEQVVRREVNALAVTVAHLGITVVVGWDVLQHCELVCNGRARTFAFKF